MYVCVRQLEINQHKLKNTEMKNLNTTDSEMTIKTSVKLTTNTVFTEVLENEKYDLIINECDICGFWKSTNKQLGEIELKINDCWLNEDNILVNQSGFITTINN